MRLPVSEFHLFLAHKGIRNKGGVMADSEIEKIILKIREKSGSVLFEIGTPDNEGMWDAAGYGMKGRYCRQGKTLLEALQNLEKDIDT
jgi:hypothetical protein